jgi:elongation factor Ts
VARTAEFQALAKDLCLQVAAFSPRWLKPEAVPESEIAHQKEIFAAQAQESGKPAAVIEKMVEGRMKKWYTEVCLLQQPALKDQERAVESIVQEMSGKLGENILVRRFIRIELGEI